MELEFQVVHLTWGEWEQTVDVLKDFYKLWDSVTMMFEVMDISNEAVLGKGIVRRGHRGLKV